ncbi:MAG TPA: hypothetical protein PL000_22885 [Anaerolineales bacterium]|nr:hypothetical protein [Anaerolineales bacterium]
MSLTDELDELIESAKLLGRTEARKENGCYTPHDSRFRTSLHESISKHRSAIEAAVLQAQPTDQRLLNLLCRIHRDGGHYIAKHGLDKAVEDADIRVAEQNAALDAQAKQEPVAWCFVQNGFTHYTDDKRDWYDAVGVEEVTPLYAAPVVPPFEDFFPDACRLALELECLLLSCNDNAAVSKWWDSAHEALEQHRELVAAPVVQPDRVLVPREPTEAMLDAAMNRYKHVSPEAKARYTQMHRENFRCDYRAMIAAAEKEISPK